MRPSWLVPCLVSVSISLPGNIHAAEGAEPRRDADGEILPAKASLRLGTRQLRHPGRGGRSLAWSADGNTLAYVGLSGGIRLVDAATGQLRLTLEIPDGYTEDLAFSPDGKALACGTRMDGVLFYDPATGAKRTLSAKGYDCLAYSSKGTYFAAASSTDYRVLDGDTQEVVLDVTTRAEITGLTFSHDEKYLLFASLRPSVAVWDLEKRKLVKRWSDAPPGEESHFVRGPAISPDGKLIAAGSTDISIIDVETMEARFRLAGDDATDLFLHMAFSPDGKQLIAASQNGPIYVWDLSEQKIKWKLAAGAWAVRDFALRPDGRQAAIVDAGNRVWVWDLEAGQLLFNDRPGHATQIYTVAYSPSGATIATGGRSKDTHLWDAQTGKHLEKIPASSTFLKFTSEEQLLTSWIYAQNIVTWRLDPAWRAKAQQGEEVLFEEKAKEDPPAQYLALSTNQKRLLRLVEAGGSSVETRTWSLHCLKYPTLEPPAPLKLDKFARAIAVSSDGRLAAFPAEEDVQLLDVETSKVLATFNGTSTLYAIAFTPDDKLLAFGGCDRAVHIWDVAQRKKLHELQGVGRCVAAIASSPNGRVVAAGGHDICRPGPDCPPPEGPSAIVLWDIASGERLATLDGFDSSVHALAFSPDGKTLVSGLQDATALVWETPEAAWSK